MENSPVGQPPTERSPAGPTAAFDLEGLRRRDSGLGFLKPPGRPDALGRLGHYEVLEALGQGGFGTLFRAFDTALERIVAIKVLAPEVAAGSPARKRFLR